MRKALQRLENRLCQKCGYDLRATPTRTLPPSAAHSPQKTQCKAGDGIAGPSFGFLVLTRPNPPLYL